MPVRLVALSGPLAGRTFPLGPAPLTIGRHADSGIQLSDLTVSRHHCAIEPDAGGFRLRDLQSRHGTFVNGVPVGDRPLAPGDLMTVGGSVFLVSDGESENPAAPGGARLDERELTAESTIYLPASEALYAQPQAVLERLPPDDRVARDLHTLLQIGSALQGTQTTEPLCRLLLDQTTAAVPAERAALLLVDRRSGEVDEAYALDRRRGSAEVFEVSRTVVERVLAERMPLLASNVLQEPRLAEAGSLRAERIRSLIAAPLIAGGRPLGLLYLDSRDAGTGLDRGHLELVAAVAGIAAPALERARNFDWLSEENRRLADLQPADMVGESASMRELYRRIARVGPSDSTVLLRGESGAGKELAARALHRASRRAGRPFVAINCATLSETLLESELFGHERGAFTGALSRKVGKLEVADTGTLFLDEVGEIPVSLQAKLLRALQEREFERLGGTRPIRVDVRVIAATNRDLEAMIRDGKFRDDLYYRLNVVALHLPPLRERREDIPLLASHFAAQVSRRLGLPAPGFTPEARACLLRYPWPGNVRELANAVERALVLGEGDLVRPEDLPESVLETHPGEPGPVGRYHEVLNEQKRRLILDAIAQASGSITRAAEALGLHPNYLHRLIRNLDLRDRLKE